MRLLRLAVLALVVIAGLAPLGPALAQDKVEVREGDSVKAVLERQVGKRVALLMRSGTEVTGTVAKVGSHVAHLTELGGREFFDAVVSLDQVQAVIVRARGR
jgi:hypothetical protein